MELENDFFYNSTIFLRGDTIGLVEKKDDAHGVTLTSKDSNEQIQVRLSYSKHTLDSVVDKPEWDDTRTVRWNLTAI